MTSESRPLLAFGPAIVGERKRKKGFRIWSRQIQVVK